jgi:uncharacterized membrane protein
MRLPEKKKLILAACVFAATLLMTCLLKIKIVNDGFDKAYINMGDIGVYAAAALLGGPLGALAASLSSALADLFVGSAVYAIPSLIIKGSMALLTAQLLKRGSDWSNIAKTVSISGAVMTLGYFLFDLLFIRYGVAAFSLPLNALQAIVNGLISIPVLKIICRKSYNEVEFSNSRVK